MWLWLQEKNVDVALAPTKLPANQLLEKAVTVGAIFNNTQ
jgi:hypothetical protein